MGYLGNQITTVFPTSISVDTATISGNTTVGGTLGVTGATTLSNTLGVTGVSTLSDNIVFDASSKGVHLGVTSATASNLLDDYEEGTWTPTVNSGTIAITTNSSRYIKVGNLVTVYTRINSFSDNTGSNDFILKSLPFTISANNPDANIGNAWGGSMGNEQCLFFYTSPNSTQTLGYYGATGSGFNQVFHYDFSSSTDMLIKLTYITA